MSDEQNPKPPSDIPLGQLGAGPRDSQLQVGKPVPSSHRKKPAAPDEGGDESTGLTFPRGALAAFWKSGGLIFRSHEVVVYHDGRVAYRSNQARRRRVVQQLEPTALETLRQQIAALVAAEVPPLAPSQSPDTYAYDLLLRHGRRLHVFAAADGSIPEALRPLLATMQALIPVEG
ncbi:MAG: hypothetical protein MUD01_20430 [Chloroflexaceae bacterium]|nr:hypothetical protein [Chloroflexaceae bacterium]